MRIVAISLGLFLIVTSVDSQIVDDFSDGDFYSNPEWKGDQYNFVINTAYQLQLDAYDAGESFLYVTYPYEVSLEIRYYFMMDFKPSLSNKLDVFIMIDTTDVNIANGYCISIGENGSDDKIIFSKLKGGAYTILGEGNLGNFADEPSMGNLKITRNKEGIWNIYSDRGDNYYVDELEVFDDEFFFDKNYFILNPKYSKSRKDKFFFDDFYLGKYIKDTIAPKINQSELISRNELVITFDEQILQENILDITNYKLVNYGTNPQKVIFSDITPNKVTLVFEDDFESGINYKLEVSNIADLQGNKIKNSIYTTFYYIDNPKFGEIVINELLFNPYPKGNDFIELKNISKKVINLKGCLLTNLSKETKAYYIKENLLLRGGEYVCITDDTFDIVNNYFIPDSVRLFYNKLPSLPDEAGNLTIYYLDTMSSNLKMIDSFDYNAEMHSAFYDDVEGISLERKSTTSLTNDRFNWSSGSTIVGGATPGYANSNTIKQYDKQFDGVSIEKKVFSPNFDSFDDELIIHYRLKSDVNLANMYIFDSEGRFVHRLVNNETIGREGLVTWDGYVDGKKMRIGVYILLSEIIDEIGNTLKSKEMFVISDNLK